MVKDLESEVDEDRRERVLKNLRQNSANFREGETYSMMLVEREKPSTSIIPGAFQVIKKTDIDGEGDYCLLFEKSRNEYFIVKDGNDIIWQTYNYASYKNPLKTARKELKRIVKEARKELRNQT